MRAGSRSHLGRIPARAIGEFHNPDDSMQINGLHMEDAQTVLQRAWPVVEKRLPFWIGLLLGLLIAWSLARLTWMLLPRPRETRPIYKTQPVTAPGFDATKLANMHLFGTATVSGPTNAPETTLNLILRGIVAASRSDQQSLAIISSNGIEQMYMTGAQLPGGAQIQSIYPDRVLLSLNGRIQSLRLPKSAGDTGTNNTVAPVTIPNAVYGNNLPPMRNLNQLRNDLIRHPEHLLDVMRAMPVMEDGKLSGYRVFPVGNSDAFSKLGLKPGDIVTAVNGMPLDNPAESMSILSKLKTSEQVSITYTRNGQQQTQVLQLQGPNTQ
jgi:general secretion pathway protein C